MVQCGRGRQGWQPSVGAGAARARDKGCPTRPKRRSGDRWGVAAREPGRSTRYTPSTLRRAQRRRSVSSASLNPEAGRTSFSTGSHDDRELGRRPGGLSRHSVTRAASVSQASPFWHCKWHCCSSPFATGIAASLASARFRPLRRSSPAGSRSCRKTPGNTNPYALGSRGDRGPCPPTCVRRKKGPQPRERARASGTSG